MTELFRVCHTGFGDKWVLKKPDRGLDVPVLVDNSTSLARKSGWRAHRATRAFFFHGLLRFAAIAEESSRRTEGQVKMVFVPPGRLR